MSTQNALAVTAPQGRTWPFNISTYDRGARLTEDERRVIASTVSMRAAKNKRWLSKNRTALTRLLRPLEDVFDYIELRDRCYRTGVIGFMLQMMHIRGTSYWAWPEQDWAEMLGTNYRAFRGYCPYNECRSFVIAFSYLAVGFTDLHKCGAISNYRLSLRIFGKHAVTIAIKTACDELKGMGYTDPSANKKLSNVVCKALLYSRSPKLEGIKLENLIRLRATCLSKSTKQDIVPLSRVLLNLGILSEVVPPRLRAPKPEERVAHNVPSEWANWCERWCETSTLQSRRSTYYGLMKAGRWIGQNRPELASPQMWGYEEAAEYVAALVRVKVGDWSVSHRALKNRLGKPLAPRGIAGNLAAMRVFFRDCYEWGWMPRRFDPGRAFRTPKSIRAQITTEPRIIADDVWAKLLWAGLNLSESDLPRSPSRSNVGKNETYYHLEMVRAIAIVWLFAGLRVDEIVRLRVGCIRWQRGDVTIPGTQEILPGDAVCWLSVPIQKNNHGFTKPVDRLVGEAINVWERLRPEQPRAPDSKTSELVQYLFSSRGMKVGPNYINHRLIPVLCQKAGIPKEDAKGNITSHRARSTIASQLYNSKEPLTLFELQEWLGHRSPSSTQHYAKVSPTKLAKKYIEAGYFERNIRTVDVLIDRDAIMSGAATQGEPWQYYDLGHGWCLNSFFVECPHRMACAKCSFYLPKASAKGQLLESRSNLLRMRQEIPLTEDEIAAVDEDIEALERLSNSLSDVPTPAGPTPRQLIQLTRSSKDSS
jgi:integrase